MISFHSTKPFVFDESRWIEHEKPSVLEALRVLSKGGYYISIGGHDYNMREKRLQKEYEENTKAPGSAENSIKEDLSGNKSIEHCGEPIPGSPLSAVEGIKLKWKDNQNTSENPALKEAASQFNDALLDEQGKKIKRFGKEIARLNKIIHKKNLKIAEKDEVIGDLGKELKAMKQQLDSYTKMAQKMAEVIVHKKPVTVDFFEMCWELAYSEEKKATEELSKVLNDVIDRFLLFGEIIIKEE